MADIVLIVDDDAAVLTMLSKVIRSNGLAAECAQRLIAVIFLFKSFGCEASKVFHSATFYCQFTLPLNSILQAHAIIQYYLQNF